MKASLSLQFNGHFPGRNGFTDTRMSLYWILLELRMMEVVLTTGAVRHAKIQSNHQKPTNPTPKLLQARCASCCPTNSTAALKSASEL